MSTGVIVARFQTPYLHDGHISLISMVNSKHNKCVILLGVSSIKSSNRNPFDYYAREKMIKTSFSDIIILPLNDNPSDEIWSKNLDQLLNDTFTGEEFIIYGSRDSFIPFYSGKSMTVELPEHGDFNATEIRKKYADKVLDSVDFRAGILYAYNNQYAKVFPTVDIAIFSQDKSQILLGRKSNSPKWRLIGGFCDPDDDSYETAALRELKEECGPIEVSKPEYVTSRKIDDWRYRNERDKIITTLFTCKLISGTPSPCDDIVELKWFHFENISSEIITSEHLILIEALKDHYSKLI